MALGEAWLSQPVTGWWTLQGFPDRVRVHGRLFRRARWKQEHPGVVEQYREEVARNSMHMMVRTDGRWTIDHIDEDNPDLGREVPHFFNDHPVGKVIKGVAAGLAVVGAAYTAVRLVESVTKAASRA